MVPIALYIYKPDWRPAQQEEEAGLAQGKLRRQLRTGRALLALGLRKGRVPAQAAVWNGYCEMLMIVFNSAGTQCARDWARRALAPTPGASRPHAP